MKAQPRRIMGPAYPDVQVPLTIGVGALDRVTPPELHGRRLHDAVPGSTLVLVDHAGHQVHHQDPEAVVAAVTQTVRAATA